MILQTNEIIFDPMDLFYLLPIIIIFIPFIISIVYLHVKDKIHDSYHKGYNQAKDDKVKYYSTIKELTDDYKEILNSLKLDFLKLPLETSTLLMNFQTTLENYYND